MAVSVWIPKEITEYEEKIMFGMSLRKIICFSIAILLGIATYLIVTFLFKISMDIASYIIIIEAVPFMAIGFIKIDGMNFEKYFLLYIRHKIGTNKLYYKPQLIINSEKNLEQGDEENDRIFKKYIFKRKYAFRRKTRDEIFKETESTLYKDTKKGRKRKRKKALEEIKRAKQEFRSAKYRKKEENM